MSDVYVTVVENSEDINITIAENTEDIVVTINEPDITSFLELLDTPFSYSGQAGKVVGVNSTEDGVEYLSSTAVWGTITGTISDQTDLQEALALKTDSTDFALHTGDGSIHFTEASIDHTAISNIGANSHAQIDTALIRVANTSGTNTGDQDLSNYFNKLVDDADDITDTATSRFTSDTDVSRLANTSGTNTGDQDLSNYFNKSTDDTDDITDTATNRFTSDTDVSRLANTSGTNTGDQVSSDFDHNALINYVENQHIDWTAATSILKTSVGGGEVANFNNTSGSTDITMRYGYVGYGWYWKYLGSGSGNFNQHELWSEGAGSTDVQVYGVTQDGKMTMNEDFQVTKNITALNLSGTNTGDQDLSGYQPLAAVLTNTTASFTTTLASNIATNNAKISFDSTSSARLANTSGTNTGDQDLAGYLLLDQSTPQTTEPSGAGLSWNDSIKSLNIHTGIGPVAQVPFEEWSPVWNNTGILIENGSVVHPVGNATNGFPNIEKALFDTHVGFTRAVWVTTMDIQAGEFGIVTTRGNVRMINTLGYTVGDNIYGSPTVAGEFTNVKPEFPNYPVQLGGVSVVGETDGEINVSTKGEASDTFNNFWNGVFRETFDFRVTATGGIITGALSPSNGHEDMTMLFSDGFAMLDTTPDATIILTAGTDEIPQTNYVYIPKSTKVLTVSTSDWPSTVEHIKVAQILLQSATATELNGALRNQNWNDAIENTSTFQGHLSHIGERIRQMPSVWHSGCEATVTIGASDEVYLATTAGVVYQMHRQNFPVLDMEVGDEVVVANDYTTSYFSTDDLSDILTDSSGGALANTSFSVVLWGTANKTGEASHLMVNMPTGTYSKNFPQTAVDDSNASSVYTIPSSFNGAGFLIARLTFINISGVWSLFDNQDLRGTFPNTTAGGGGVTSWTALSDTPSTISALGVVQGNAGGTALEFTSVPTISNLNITATTDKNYVSDSQLVIIGNTSGTNTGDQDLSNYFNKLVDDSDDITDTATSRFTSDTAISRLANTSGTNTGDNATNTQYSGLVGNVMADTLHRHSELSASDGSPDPALKVDSGGNVGIGTTTPYAKCHIVDGTLANKHYFIEDTVVFEGVEGAMQFIAADTGSYAGSIALTAVPTSGNNKHWGLVGGGPTKGNRFFISYIETTAATSLGSFSSGVKFAIEKNGNVGIGIEGATRKLEVIGNGYFSTTLQAGGTITGSNLSGTNTGDQDLSGYQPLATVLTNTTASFTTTLASNIATNNAKISFDSTSSARLANTSGTNTGDNTVCTSGAATTATTLATARAINGVDFDGSSAITVTAAAGTLSGTTLKSTILTSSLTSVGALNAGSITSGFGAIDVGTSAISGGAISGTTGTFSGDVSLSVGKKIYFPTGISIGENSTNLDAYGVIIGRNTGASIESGAVGNIGIGYSALRALTIGGYNVAVGNGAGRLITIGNNNVCVGPNAGGAITNGIQNVFLGVDAGRYETGNKKLFIDSINRTDESTARTDSLIFGVFNGTPANQTLRINGQFSTLGKVNVDNTTDATTTTDGSLQTDGGLSVAKKGVFGDTVKVGNKVYQEEGASAYDSSQTLTLSTVIANTSSYLLTVIRDISANSQANGLYLIGRRGTTNIVTAIVDIPQYTVSINASDQIEILNDATASVIHATLLRLY